MARRPMLGLLLVLCWVAPTQGAPPADATLRSAFKVLQEVRTTPGKQIPAGLLASAHGVVIIPDAIKLGLIGGLRSGYGVVLLRQPDGAWSLPQFVTIAGASLGLQIGIEDIDMVLVFMTPQSAAGLARGKFTIGTDASASAGPVGRDANRMTDGRLNSEILSYTRSRGLFVGASLDGAKLGIDRAGYKAYYGAAADQPPLHVPEAAAALRVLLAGVANGAPEVANLPPTPRYDPPTGAAKLKPFRRSMTGFGGAAGAGT